eukprot:403366525
MRKIFISVATLMALTFVQAQESQAAPFKLEQQKKCKADPECKPKKCLRGICANPTFADLFAEEQLATLESERISLEAPFKLEQQKKCKADPECKPKKCLRGICANPTFVDLFNEVVGEVEEVENISLKESIFKLEQQKKCKADTDCKPKKCIRGICCNPTFMSEVDTQEDQLVQGCRDSSSCGGGVCVHGTCQAYATVFGGEQLLKCGQPSDCPEAHKCHEGLCRSPLGLACKSDSQCGTKFCIRGTCQNKTLEQTQ